MFNWSSPDEQERQAQVRNWKRLLQIAADLECGLINSELSGDPTDPLRSEHAFYRSMEELAPDFERHGIALNLEAHPYDFAERNDDAVHIIRGLDLPWVNYVFCAPHAFHLSDGAGDVGRMMRYAGQPGYNTCTSPTATTTAPTSATATSSTRPASTPASTNTTRSATATSRGTEFFTALREQSFDGIATVCVFGWEEDADDIHRRMLDRITSELAS